MNKVTMKAKTRVLVTGGAGFIGSHLSEWLVDRGYDTYIIDDLSSGRKELIPVKASFYRCDLRDSRLARRIINHIKPQIFYHLAASAAEIKSQFSPIEITSRNFPLFINAIVPAISAGKLKRFIFTSSAAVYGQQKGPLKETITPKPEDLYGVQKWAIEESLKILAQVHEFEYVIARAHNIYGPRQNLGDPYRNVIAIFMNSLLAHTPFVIYGDGKQVRAFTYIDDAVKALGKCATFPVAGFTINIGADLRISINDLSTAILQISGERSHPVYAPARPREVKVTIPDHTLAKKLLKLKYATPLMTGLKLTWADAQARGYQKPVFQPVELPSTKLPKLWQKEKQKKMKVAIIRGPSLNPWEMQNFSPLTSHIDIFAVGSKYAPFGAAEIQFPVQRLWCLGELLSGVPFGVSLLQQLCGDVRMLLGFENLIKGVDVLHAVELGNYMSYQAVLAKRRGLVKKVAVTVWETIPQFGD